MKNQMNEPMFSKLKTKTKFNGLRPELNWKTMKFLNFWLLMMAFVCLFNLNVFNLTSVTKGNWHGMGINYNSIGFWRKQCSLAIGNRQFSLRLISVDVWGFISLGSIIIIQFVLQFCSIVLWLAVAFSFQFSDVNEIFPIIKLYLMLKNSNNIIIKLEINSVISH